MQHRAKVEDRRCRNGQTEQTQPKPNRTLRVRESWGSAREGMLCDASCIMYHVSGSTSRTAINIAPFKGRHHASNFVPRTRRLKDPPSPPVTIHHKSIQRSRCYTCGPHLSLAGVLNAFAVLLHTLVPTRCQGYDTRPTTVCVGNRDRHTGRDGKESELM